MRERRPGGGVHRPARRHGRVLRQRRGAAAPGAGRHPGDRRRRRQPRRGHLGHLRGPPLRRARGHADRPGAAAVPDGDGAAGRHGALLRGLPVGHGAVPLDHPAGRAAEPGRGVPRRLAAPAAGWATRRRSASTSAPGSSTSRASPARSASPAPSSSPSSPPPAPSPTGCSSSARPRSWTSCTRCRSARCGAWAPRPRRSCCGSGCAPSATSRTCRRRPCSGRWARPRARTCTSCRGGGTRAGWCPTSRRSPPATRRPSAPTSTTRR